MKTIKNIIVVFVLLLAIVPEIQGQSTVQKPIRMAIAGMTHGHIAFILGRKAKDDFQLVGIFEPNTELANKLLKKYGFDPKLVYNNLETMLEKVNPEVVVAFGSVFEHITVVEACASRGIDVMVEKPLATSVAHAKGMAELVQKYHTPLLTDFETSWYPTTAKSFQLVNDSRFIGNIRKVVFHDGHQGPKEIGCDQVFLDWLTDPVQNGGGALIDFGYYGANLMTYLMKGEQPISVTAKDIPVYIDPFDYFYDVLKGKVKMSNYDLYSLPNNMVVVEILEAARESAKIGKTIFLKN